MEKFISAIGLQQDRDTKNIKQKQDHGFTLIELIVVISIISLFSSITLAVTQDAREKARNAKVLTLNDPIHKILSLDCIGYWTFENSLSPGTDFCGNNAGTIVGAEVNKGIKGNALKFDNQDRVNLGNVTVPGEKITVTALFKATQWSGTENYIVSKWGSGAQSLSYALSVVDSGGNRRLRFSLRTNNNTILTADSGNIALDRWYLAAGTYDGAVMRLYLDGEEVGNGTKTGVIAVSGANAFIGDRTTGSATDNWIGQIDEVGIYKNSF